ncbi:MAG: hypothetical protein KY450_12270, partial [Actinobacteria bacterium]|nr:hypothetical protein [Actinomycetota bacterium]
AAGGAGLPLALLARGTSDPDANAEACRVTRLVAEHTGAPLAVAGFSGVAAPSVPETLEQLRRLGATRVAAFAWYLATGILLDRMRRDFAAADVHVVDAGTFIVGSGASSRWEGPVAGGAAAAAVGLLRSAAASGLLCPAAVLLAAARALLRVGSGCLLLRPAAARFLRASAPRRTGLRHRLHLRPAHRLRGALLLPRPLRADRLHRGRAVAPRAPPRPRPDRAPGAGPFERPPAHGCGRRLRGAAARIRRARRGCAAPARRCRPAGCGDGVRRRPGTRPRHRRRRRRRGAPAGRAPGGTRRASRSPRRSA